MPEHYYKVDLSFCPATATWTATAYDPLGTQWPPAIVESGTGFDVEHACAALSESLERLRNSAPKSAEGA